MEERSELHVQYIWQLILLVNTTLVLRRVSHLSGLLTCYYFGISGRGSHLSLEGKRGVSMKKVWEALH